MTYFNDLPLDSNNNLGFVKSLNNNNNIDAVFLLAILNVYLYLNIFLLSLIKVVYVDFATEA